DYYQPEAYVPQTDTFIEKDAQINEEIDKLRHSATSALFERDDVIIISSVSCIYGLGNPEEYKEMVVSARVGMQLDRNEFLRRLVDIQYTRNDIDFKRGTFRVRGDIVEVFPASEDEECIRVEFFGDEIDRKIGRASCRERGERTKARLWVEDHRYTHDVRDEVEHT